MVEKVRFRSMYNAQRNHEHANEDLEYYKKYQELSVQESFEHIHYKFKDIFDKNSNTNCVNNSGKINQKQNN